MASCLCSGFSNFEQRVVKIFLRSLRPKCQNLLKKFRVHLKIEIYFTLKQIEVECALNYIVYNYFPLNSYQGV